VLLLLLVLLLQTGQPLVKAWPQNQQAQMLPTQKQAQLKPNQMLVLRLLVPQMQLLKLLRCQQQTPQSLSAAQSHQLSPGHQKLTSRELMLLHCCRCQPCWLQSQRQCWYQMSLCQRRAGWDHLHLLQQHPLALQLHNSQKARAEHKQECYHVHALKPPTNVSL
jgi:hypothetical protein